MVSMSQRSRPWRSTGAFSKRCTGRRVTSPPSARPAMTRPPEAPTSTAPKTLAVTRPYRRNAAATPLSTGMIVPVV